MKSIILGGGCFWCLEAVYQRMKGVESAVSGYAGGTAETANYEAVCSGLTKHVEVVKVTYDEQLTSLEEILEVFWTIHDPTTPNRQGNDRGPQYRSAIFYISEEEQNICLNSIKDVAEKLYEDPVVTELIPFEVFYQAEDYHQDYFNNNPGNTYCNFVVGPKLTKFKQTFAQMLKD